jgi:hypothetical protein
MGKLLSDEQILKYLTQYCDSYLARLGEDRVSSSQELDVVFSESWNERVECTKYFMWLLDERLGEYIQKGWKDYAVLGSQILYFMDDHLLYNSYYTQQLFIISEEKLASVNLKRDFRPMEKLWGWKSYHMLQICQKFVWNFVSRLERELS